MLLGRASECARIQAALDAALAGESAVIVVSGEPGIGKSALLEYAVTAGDGMTVLATRGFESESELAFASLTELLRPLEQDSVPFATCSARRWPLRSRSGRRWTPSR